MKRFEVISVNNRLYLFSFPHITNVLYSVVWMNSVGKECGQIINQHSSRVNEKVSEKLRLLIIIYV